ncbi:hypothetical protein NE237_020339 [Protea cynaroides]|uniref:Uncharacterized protein n=1 Tax=Protea cynaroides TaxID=273540 RepID=A0A9Q0HAW4_9MAGN|nr:hypothetical protein NE237_020339 [Protea cynaroides]
MASMKAERPVGTQLFGQAKKEPTAKPGESGQPKPPAGSKQAPAKKSEQKPREPKKKAKGGKPASKN